MISRHAHRSSPASLAVAATLTLGSADALAWSLPEHIVLSEEALPMLPPGATSALQAALHKVHSVDSTLCPDLSSRFYGGPQAPPPACIPYAALAALAGDHTSSATDLERLLDRNGGPSKAGRFLAGAHTQWKEFLGTAPLPNGRRLDVTRRDLVRKLDVYLTFADSGYVDRTKNAFTHFQAADEPLAAVLSDLVHRGRVDNALGQFVAHHLRSLQLAAGARAPKLAAPEAASLMRTALFEHAHAVHFLQDAFSAGHAVSTRKQRDDPDSRIMRHDHFSRVGVSLVRVLGATPCALERTMPSANRSHQLPGCWHGHGDGFLGEPGDDERRHVIEATARVKLEFAIAVDPAWATALAAAEQCPPNGSPSSCRMSWPLELSAELLDPEPSWSRPRGLAPDPSAEKPCDYAQSVLRGAVDAIESLGGDRVIPAIHANNNAPRPGVLTPKQVGAPLGCIPPSPGTPTSQGACQEPSRALRGTPGYSLLRPILAGWPVPQADVETLRGSDPSRHGMAWSVTLGLPSGAQSGNGTTLGMAGAFVGAGVSYRAEHMFRARPNAGVIEANAGVQVVGFIGSLPAEDRRLEARLWGELRWPAISLGIWTWAVYHFEATGSGNGLTNFLSRLEPLGGARVYVDLTGHDRVRFEGVDVEVLGINLPMTPVIRGAQHVSLLPNQLRLRAGYSLDARAATATIEFAAGFSGMFRSRDHE